MHSSLRRIVSVLLVPCLSAEPVLTSILSPEVCIERVRTTKIPNVDFQEQALAGQIEEAQFSRYPLMPRYRVFQVQQTAAQKMAGALPSFKTWVGRILLFHFGFEIPEDPAQGVRQVIDLYAQGQYGEVNELARRLAKDHLAANLAALLPMMPYRMLALETTSLTETQRIQAFDIFIPLLMRKTAEARFEMLRNFPSQERARAALGLAVLNCRLAQHYQGNKEPGRSGLQYESVLAELPEADALTPYESGMDLVYLRYLIEASAAAGLRDVRYERWQKTWEVSDLERAVEAARQSERAYKRIYHPSLLHVTLVLGWGLLELSEYRSNQVYETEIEDCLATAASRSGHQAERLGLKGALAARRSDRTHWFEAEKLLKESLAIDPYDPVRGALMRLYWRTGRLEEAARISGEIQGKEPRELYEAGEIQFERAAYPEAFENWSALLNSNNIQIIEMLRYPLTAFYKNFFIAALKSGKSDTALRLAALYLNRPDATPQDLIALVKEALFENQTKQQIFLKQFLPRCPQKDRPILERELRLMVEPAGEAPAIAQAALRAEWERLKIYKKVRAADLDSLFASPRWMRQSALWRFATLEEWVRQWRVRPGASSPREPAKAQHGEILKRLVLELRRNWMDEDRQALASRHSALAERIAKVGLQLRQQFQKRRAARDQLAKRLATVGERLEAKTTDRKRLERLIQQFNEALETSEFHLKPVAGGTLFDMPATPFGVTCQAGRVNLIDAAQGPRPFRFMEVDGDKITLRGDRKEPLLSVPGRLAGIQINPEGAVKFFLTDKAYDAILTWMGAVNLNSSLELWPERAIPTLSGVLTGEDQRKPNRPKPGSQLGNKKAALDRAQGVPPDRSSPPPIRATVRYSDKLRGVLSPQQQVLEGESTLESGNATFRAILIRRGIWAGNVRVETDAGPVDNLDLDVPDGTTVRLYLKEEPYREMEPAGPFQVYVVYTHRVLKHFFSHLPKAQRHPRRVVFELMPEQATMQGLLIALGFSEEMHLQLQVARDPGETDIPGATPIRPKDVLILKLRQPMGVILTDQAEFGRALLDAIKREDWAEVKRLSTEEAGRAEQPHWRPVLLAIAEELRNDFTLGYPELLRRVSALIKRNREELVQKHANAGQVLVNGRPTPYVAAQHAGPLRELYNIVLDWSIAPLVAEIRARRPGPAEWNAALKEIFNRAEKRGGDKHNEINQGRYHDPDSVVGAAIQGGTGIEFPFRPNDFEANILPGVFQSLGNGPESMNAIRAHVEPSPGRFNGVAARSIIRYAVVGLRHRDERIRGAAEELIREIMNRWPEGVLPETAIDDSTEVSKSLFDKLVNWAASGVGNEEYIRSVFAVAFDRDAGLPADADLLPILKDRLSTVPGRRLLDEFLESDPTQNSLSALEKSLQHTLLNGYRGKTRWDEEDVLYLERLYINTQAKIGRFQEIVPETERATLAISRLKKQALALREANSLKTQKRFSEALASLKSLLVDDPREPYFWGELVKMYLMQSPPQRHEALEALDRGFAIVLHWGLGHSLAAQIHEDLGDLPRAIAHREQEMLMARRNIQALSHLGRLYKRIGDNSKARRAYQRILALDPSDRLAELGLARLPPEKPIAAPQDSHEQTSSFQETQSALAHTPRDPVLRFTLIRQLAQAGHMSQAQIVVNEAPQYFNPAELMEHDFQGFLEGLRSRAASPGIHMGAWLPILAVPFLISIPSFGGILSHFAKMVSHYQGTAWVAGILVAAISGWNYRQYLVAAA